MTLIKSLVSSLLAVFGNVLKAFVVVTLAVPAAFYTVLAAFHLLGILPSEALRFAGLAETEHTCGGCVGLGVVVASALLAWLMHSDSRARRRPPPPAHEDVVAYGWGVSRLPKRDDNGNILYDRFTVSLEGNRYILWFGNRRAGFSITAPFVVNKSVRRFGLHEISGSLLANLLSNNAKALGLSEGDILLLTSRATQLRRKL